MAQRVDFTRVPVISKVPVEVYTIAATDYGPSVLSPHSVL